MRSCSSVSANASDSPVARKTWQTSSVKPGEVKNVCRCSHSEAALPISSASSRLAVSSGSSPSTSSLPAGSSSRSGTPTASRGWRTSQIRSPSWQTTPTAPVWRTISRVASSPSSWRNVSSRTLKILPS